MTAGHRTRRLVSLVLLTWTIESCATSGTDQNFDDLGWPPDDPRVRLERVIAVRSDIKGRSFLKTLVGEVDERLFERPFGGAWAGGSLLITDPGAGAVLKIDHDGNLSRSEAGALDSPIGVASCWDLVAVSDSRSGTVELLDHKLRHAATLVDGLQRPTGLACVGDELAVTETGAHRVVFVARDGSSRSMGHRGPGGGEFNFPTAIGVAGDHVWVGDTLNFRLQRIAVVSGLHLGGFGDLGDAAGDMPRVKAIAVDASGRLWVSDAHLDQVAIFSAAGEYLMSIGGSGNAPGHFDFPAGIAAHPDGRVAVVDSLNRRVQIFRSAESEVSDDS